MFSDFQDYVIGVPQIVPLLTNNKFDAPEENEDFGREQATQDPADRYKFRTPSLRNAAVQPAFMHNGAFTSLEDAVRHHLDARASAMAFTPAGQGLPPDLSGSLGPLEPVLARLDPLMTPPVQLSEAEFSQLVAFVRNGLLDPRARPENLRQLVPHVVPSGRPVLTFEFQ
jgi:cytochrome c peroxidase